MHIMKKQVLLIILLALPLWLKAADVSVTGLRTEQMVRSHGVGYCCSPYELAVGIFSKKCDADRLPDLGCVFS